jgi:toxin ParE1/3/4
LPSKIRKRPQADLDLDSIWRFVAADNVRAADRLIERIGEVLHMLLRNPLAGRERADLRQDLRYFPVASYLVFYAPVSDGIEVFRVMSGRQDIDADDMA